jgi:hypothetical protein
MNTDYGFFNLFVALDSVRKVKNQPLPGERNSTNELPEVDYSLLRAVSAVDARDQDCQFRAELFGLNARTPAYSSGRVRLTYSPS